MRGSVVGRIVIYGDSSESIMAMFATLSIGSRISCRSTNNSNDRNSGSVLQWLLLRMTVASCNDNGRPDALAIPTE